MFTSIGENDISFHISHKSSGGLFLLLDLLGCCFFVFFDVVVT